MTDKSSYGKTGSTGSSTSGGNTTGSNIQQNWNTPINQLGNRLQSGNFDDYVLVAKKGNDIELFSNGSKNDDSTSELFESAQSVISPSMEHST